MTQRAFSTAHAYQSVVRGLLQLHRLSMAGLNDCPEADLIRAAMEKSWECLTESERARLAGLSADLDSIENASHETLPSIPQAQRKLNEAYEARQAAQWDKA